MKKNWLWIILFLFFLLLILLQYLKTESVESFHIENHSSNKIPNKIWTFWDGEVPDVVEKCISSWRKYNPTYSIVVLNKENLSNYLEPQEIEILNHPNFNDSVQRFSDVVRLLILSKYGGFWIDASIICHTSFDWIHEIQEKKQVEIVGYYLDGFTLSDYKIHSPVIESWFFACIPNSPFVKDWCNEFLSIRGSRTVGLGPGASIVHQRR
jgi:mannosyltransferase OCH1-like enzyme